MLASSNRLLRLLYQASHNSIASSREGLFTQEAVSLGDTCDVWRYLWLSHLGV